LTPQAITSKPKTLRKSDRKYYNKKSLIYSDKAKLRLKKFNRNKDVVYQSVNIHKVGFAHSYIVLDVSLNQTRLFFNDRYHSNLRTFHCNAITFLADYCAKSPDGTFNIRDVESIVDSLGYVSRLTKTSRVYYPSRAVVLYLCKLHYFNPLGHGFYTPTTRAQQFLRLFNTKCEEMFEKFSAS
jgi:hypothetical protein